MKGFCLVICIFLSSVVLGQYTLCIEGGGTKTHLQILNKDGNVMTMKKNAESYDLLQATGSNINVVGIDGVRAVFRNLFENVSLDEDSVPLLNVISDCRVVAGMAGVGLPKNKDNVIAILEEFGIAKDRIFVTTDAQMALALIDQKGIVLISGTGSICFAKDSEVLFRVGGLGKILGDEGSGYQIGLSAIKAALAEEYGWGKKTSLTVALKEHFQNQDLKNLIPQINLGQMSGAQVASVTPIVFQKAMEKDSVSEDIVNQAVKDLASLIKTELEISHLSDCEIHFWGGVFKNSNADTFIQKIASEVDPEGTKNLKMVNMSLNNSAFLYAKKFQVYRS